MSPKEKRRFNRQYNKHLQTLKLQGMSDKTIDVYARAVRRLVERFDKCPDRLSKNNSKITSAFWLNPIPGALSELTEMA